MNYVRLGDTAHWLTIASTIIYAASVVGAYHSSLFDPEWRKNGFCVTNEDRPFWNSHDMCFYVDTLATGLLFLVYWNLKSTPGLSAANDHMKIGLPGIIGHGIGHGAIAAAMRDMDREEMDVMSTQYGRFMEARTAWEMLMQILPGLIFWLTLLKASMSHSSNITVAAASVAAFVANLFVQGRFGFTFVQTILLLAFSANQLNRPKAEKDFSYAMYPLVVALPLTIVGWIESTQCSIFVRDYFYGHVIYDGFIPASVLVWYLLCYANAKGKVKVL